MQQIALNLVATTFFWSSTLHPREIPESNLLIRSLTLTGSRESLRPTFINFFFPITRLYAIYPLLIIIIVI